MNSDESHVWFKNNTRDGWAFVTEVHYQKSCIHTRIGTHPQSPSVPLCVGGKSTTDHSWCVGPGEFVKRGFLFYVDQVRVEVTMTSSCRQPIVYDKRVAFKRNGAISTNQFELVGHGGHYSFSNRT